MAAVSKTRRSEKLTLKDRLSRLTFPDACKLLGPDGKNLILRNANTWPFKVAEHVYLGNDLFRLSFPDTQIDGQPVTVTMTLMADVLNRLHWRCSHCRQACEHVGAAFSFILEAKTPLGLAAKPKPREPVASLNEEDLTRLALAEREARSREEKMAVESLDPKRPWTDYEVTNKLSGKTYRVALRGTERGESYCSCPDFRNNTLGTCKHVMHVLRKVRRKFDSRTLRKPFVPKQAAVYVHYLGEPTLRLQTPPELSPGAQTLLEPLMNRPIDDVADLVERLGKLQQLREEVLIYPDAEEFIQQRLFHERMRRRMAVIRRDPHNHKLRTSLLKIPLLPYQLDGVAFAVGAGRAVLADDMGLGKTIQGVGIAELLAREADIGKVLVICPASLKSQWRNEIRRFCDRDVQLIGGSTSERHANYSNECFFTVCNYEQVLRDLLPIEQVPWDLIILDEGQRIKNWEAKTSRTIKGLRSKFALVLSGTPLENRLDELYSVVQFIDDRRLGPGFRFFNRHRIVDEKGKVLGYKNLAELREALKPVLLRRTRESVRLELPPRTTEFVRIPPTGEQLEIHRGHMLTVAAITSKKFLTEMDLLRLRMALLMCRMVADGTYLVDKKKPNWSTKLDRLAELFDQIFEEPDRKAVLFSEWTTMLDLIEPLLQSRKLDFVRLDGSVPQREREELVHRFQNDPTCRLFLTTNAGSTGLNLQAADTIINVDLPWNPAVLEQRVARAHRMGQSRPVHVFVLVTEQTIEEKLLATLAAKKDLALAALDADSDVDQVDMATGMEELKSRLEVLLGAAPEAPIDETVRAEAAETNEQFSPVHRERVASAGGELLGAAFKLLGELVAAPEAAPPAEAVVNQVRAGLNSCVETDGEGKPRLTIALPDQSALEQLAQSLAKLLVAGGATAN